MNNIACCNVIYGQTLNVYFMLHSTYFFIVEEISCDHILLLFPDIFLADQETALVIVILMTADTRLCSDRARVHLTSQSHQPETIPVKKYLNVVPKKYLNVHRHPRFLSISDI